MASWKTLILNIFLHVPKLPLSKMLVYYFWKISEKITLKMVNIWDLAFPGKKKPANHFNYFLYKGC